MIGLKISSVEPFILHVPLGKEIADSVNRTTEWGLPGVKIYTDSGLIGTGYTSTLTHNDQQIYEILRDYYAPLLIEQDPTRNEEIWQKLYWSNVHWVGRMGITTMAQAAVDIALWDIKAQAAGLPLWKLLGGHKNQVKSYNTDGGWLNLSINQLTENMGKFLEEGWTGVKMKVGSSDPRVDVARVAAVRKELGYDFDLMIDVNQYWDLTTARTWAPRFEEYQIGWLEEPMGPDDVRTHALLAQATSIPLALGEHIYTVGQFRDFIINDAVQYVQVDCTRIGGVTPWLQVAAIAKAFNIAVVPHHADMMRVHQHLAAATPASNMIECIFWLQDIFEEPLDIRRGVFFLPETPGASTTIRHDMFDKFRIA